jgi:hypothetical protein
MGTEAQVSTHLGDIPRHLEPCRCTVYTRSTWCVVAMKVSMGANHISDLRERGDELWITTFDNLECVHVRVDLHTSQRSTRLHCAFSAQIELNATELRLQYLLKAETIKCCGGANLNLTLRNACSQTQRPIT